MCCCVICSTPEVRPSRSPLTNKICKMGRVDKSFGRQFIFTKHESNGEIKKKYCIQIVARSTHGLVAPLLLAFR
jgi:hypothetical protein